ncbi:hypothetical protein QQF64_034530 [Cirrhinus molitorella]|uniref:Uncharacterized protein n=1 Tax=Cirrhinus molitorella TaxID=172907 RepID=A0ABR3L5P1_9TELE
MLGLQLDNLNAGQKHHKKVDGEEDVLVYIERNRHVSMSEKIKCECNTDDDELDTSLCANFFQGRDQMCLALRTMLKKQRKKHIKALRCPLVVPCQMARLLDGGDDYRLHH